MTEMFKCLDNVVPGSKIWFEEYKQGWTVQARSERFIICTKPLNAQRTVLYTIIDLETKKRGPDDRVFCLGYKTVEQCEENLMRLEQDFMKVSQRNHVPLRIRKVVN